MNRNHCPLQGLGSRLKALPEAAPTAARILLIGEECADCQQGLADALPNCRFVLEVCPETARNRFLSSPFSLVILGHSQRLNCLDWLPWFKQLRPSISVIVITACGCEELAVQTFRHGAIDYFRRPLDLAALELTIRAVLGYYQLHQAGGTPEPAGGLAQALRFIDANFTTPIGLAQAAAAAGMSLSCFERQLKQLTGKAFVAYRNSLRVARAKELLQAHRCPMLQVALACGFRNQSDFNRVFKKIAGVTPSAYRQSR